MTGTELKQRISIILAKQGKKQADLARMLDISTALLSNKFTLKDVPSGFIE